MRQQWLWVGILASLGTACAANPADTGGGAGASAVGGTAAASGSGGFGATGGSGGFGANGGSGGFGALGGSGGSGGYAAVDGGYAAVDGGGQNLVGPDGGPCVEGVVCVPVNPDDVGCGTLTLDTEVETVKVPGNLLLVFDRSGSMEQDWNGMTRWQAAGTAMVNALTPIANDLTIGMVSFPSPGGPPVVCGQFDFACLFGTGLTGNCAVNPITAADQITFKPGPAAIAELMGPPPKYQPVAAGRTPTSEGIARANEALNATQLTGAIAVVLITDGDPNCMWDQAATVNIITGWAARGIKTYVVGLPGLGGNGMAILTALAQAGGTAPYLTPADSAQLTAQMASIVSSTISVGFNSCSITISPPTQVPDELQLVVTENGIELGVARDLGNGAGWTITPDGSLVELTGALCDDAKAGRFSKLEFKFGCIDLPQLPPPPPPD